MAKWPDIIQEDILPFAIHHAVTFLNSSIRGDKEASPYELFTGETPPWNLNEFRVFGCPAYVLHKKVQDSESFRSPEAGEVYMLDSLCITPIVSL
jgi:hypothetical protein